MFNGWQQGFSLLWDYSMQMQESGNEHVKPNILNFSQIGAAWLLRMFSLSISAFKAHDKHDAENVLEKRQFDDVLILNPQICGV